MDSGRPPHRGDTVRGNVNTHTRKLGLMRFAARLIVLAGAAAGLTVVSAATSGGIGAASFLLAHFMGALTVGVIVATAAGHSRRPMREVPDRTFTGHCHECGRPLFQVSWVWFCSVCDRAPALHLPYVGRRR